MEIWGHAHIDYGNMVPLREPQAEDGALAYHAGARTL